VAPAVVCGLSSPEVPGRPHWCGGPPSLKSLTRRS